ncbi:helix-turn-helix transcriptional regulator [Bradyrhizobium genosp. L]|uniref:helix-turn-helix domain-containing protein n=1 Tax=Bradyrhizobium genosp. L TaxID=83637 RepID=UPI0018A26298|nr:AraC family transcriptional regulator [Bradyrhizobium genosp. L]QPF84691.1 helix-turn-helix transcriptional regulator [Bradyrhizobium genosp. L]
MDAIVDAKGLESVKESGHRMLITPERVFYAGLLGRPRERCPGAFHVYVAIRDALHLLTSDGQDAHGEIAVTMPNLRHTITSEYRAAICVAIEPESVPDGTLEAVARQLQGPDAHRFANRIRAAYASLAEMQHREVISNAEFDTMCFGDALPQRVLDPRVLRAIARIGRFSGEPVTAAGCAAEAGLSASRFLHLFKEQTGISFRSFRAWKRARYLLHFANQDINLAHLAQDIGYPDSTHFSHSIRRFYGLKPRAIFSGSRDLAIYRAGQVVNERAL